MGIHFTCIHHYNRKGNIWTCKHHWEKWDAGWYKLDERLKIFQQTCINGTKFWKYLSNLPHLNKFGKYFNRCTLLKEIGKYLT